MGGPRLDPETRVWYCGQWNSPESVEKRRRYVRERQRARRAATGAAPRKIRRERALANQDQMAPDHPLSARPGP